MERFRHDVPLQLRRFPLLQACHKVDYMFYLYQPNHAKRRSVAIAFVSMMVSLEVFRRMQESLKRSDPDITNIVDSP